MIKSLDSYLISKAQWFCDKFHDLTGLTKFILQKQAFILSVVFLWIFIIAAENEAIYNQMVMGVFVISAIFQIGLVIIHCRQVDKEEAEFFRSGKLMYSPFQFTPIRLSYLLLQVIFLLPNLMLGFPNTILSLALVFLMAWVYFSICLPKPPMENKARELYEKGLWWLSGKLGGKSAPVPSPG